MPEGDTVHRSAAALRLALRDRRVTAFDTTVPQVRSRAPGRLVGGTVADVEARGKHLLHWFAPGDLALRTHMRMSGSWHLYRRGERWRKPSRLPRVVIEVPGWTAVCLSAPVVELLGRAEVERHAGLAALGPDAVAPGTDLAEARRRLDARAEWPVAEALLDQRVLAGVGNVYKSEVLFVCAVDPWTPVDSVDPATRDSLLATAERLLKANAGTVSPARVATGARPRGRSSGRLHVYGRAGRPCPRCRSRVRVARQGDPPRLTYWCARCQGPGPRLRAR